MDDPISNDRLAPAYESPRLGESGIADSVERPVVERDAKGRFVEGVGGNPDGCPPLILDADQLEVVRKTTANGARVDANASYARQLKISVSTWKRLKDPARQGAEIAEAIEKGRCDLHDVLIRNEVDLALNATEAHVRERATAYLLSSNFAYRVNGEPPLVNVNVGGEGPQLTVVQEILPTSAHALAAAMANRDSNSNPMLMHGETVKPRAASEQETSLASAWETERR